MDIRDWPALVDLPEVTQTWERSDLSRNPRSCRDFPLPTGDIGIVHVEPLLGVRLSCGHSYSWRGLNALGTADDKGLNALDKANVTRDEGT